MRRIALLAAVVALLAGCSVLSKPAGTDGDLTNGWAAQPSPSERVPATGSCLTTGGIVAYNDKADPQTTPADCTGKHKLEVVKTGRFPDDSSVPGWGSKPMQAAYADCGKAASDYLGADWHTGWLFVHVGRPSSAAWAGGARTYVCGLAEFERTDYSARALERTSSLKGELAKADTAAAKRCVRLVGSGSDSYGFYKSIAGEERVDCATPHDGEFAGMVALPDGAYPSWQAQSDYLFPRCLQIVAAWLGLSENAFNRRTDIWLYYTYLDDETQWFAGDRTSGCYAMVPTKHLVKASIKGLGGGKLPA
ncbi:septum formation family protein [Dactylosporangium sp. CA-139066]|uniref:septum formation family protein n=1 Tax=Dactylosporangium sp. CA-139066 TaxID=3239930 RepID=UPI003D917293